MKAERILITPSIAKNMLEANVNNRKPAQGQIGRYVHQMRSGLWKEDTGEAIQVSKSGRILNGQHRLMALSIANVSLNFLVVSELEDGIFDVLDTGKKRNAGDAFAIAGIKYETQIPSMIQLYNILSNTNGLYTGGNTIKNMMTNSVLLEEYYKRSAFWDETVKFAKKSYNRFAKVLTPQLIGGLYAYFYDKSPIDAHTFIEQLTTGENIRNNTIAILRTRLIEDKLSHLKMTTPHRNALIIKAWNHYRRGVVVKSLKYNNSTEEKIVAI